MDQRSGFFLADANQGPFQIPTYLKVLKVARSGAPRVANPPVQAVQKAAAAKAAKAGGSIAQSKIKQLRSLAGCGFGGEGKQAGRQAGRQARSSCRWRDCELVVVARAHVQRRRPVMVVAAWSPEMETWESRRNGFGKRVQDQGFQEGWANDKTHGAVQFLGVPDGRVGGHDND